MFGILKKRWAILRSSAFYDIITHWCIICCMLHNLIKNETPIDAMEEEIKNNRIWDNVDEAQFIESIKPSNVAQFIVCLDNLTQEMWNIRNNS